MRFVRDFIRFHRLKTLQQAYYSAAEKNDLTILAYLDELREARKDALLAVGESKPVVALHVGSGGHDIEGWINIDLELAPPMDAVVDVCASLPFRSASIDYIHSEDFIEHIDLSAGKLFISEAFRVLRPGGVMRLLTPDLNALVNKVYLGRHADQLRWCASYLASGEPCEALNMHLRMNGDHRFVYDSEYMTKLLSSAGFSVRQVRFNRSTVPHLRFLDLRDFGVNMFLEAVKGRDS